MPLNLVDLGVSYTIQKVCGTELQRHHLKSLGFVQGETVTLLTRLHGYSVALVKGSRIGLSDLFAKLIIVSFC